MTNSLVLTENEKGFGCVYLTGRSFLYSYIKLEMQLSGMALLADPGRLRVFLQYVGVLS